jgi:O-antigen/teichoic acid export membrane protein
MSSSEFAYYSFGMSLIGFVSIFINAVTQSFYPHLSKNYTNELIMEYRNMFFVIGSFSVLWYFIIVLIVNKFIPKYTESLIITGVLLTTIPGILIVQSLYVNMYKVLKKESKFLKDIFMILIMAILISVVLFYLFKNKLSVAVAAVISVYLWIIFPPSFIKINVKKQINEIIYLFVFIGGFLFIIISEFNIIYKILLTFISLIIINIIFFYKTQNKLFLKIRHLII